MPEGTIGALVLAAGRSRRFGADKRSARLPDGTSLLSATLARLGEVYQELLVVLREDDDSLAADLASRGLQTLPVADSILGMAHSLAGGARAIIDTRPDWAACAVCLGDMPFIRAETLGQLNDAWRGAAHKAPIVMPVYDGKPGHPVIFACDYLPELTRLTGDNGARPVLGAHPDALTRLDVDDPGVRRDVDVPADINRRND